MPDKFVTPTFGISLEAAREVYKASPHKIDLAKLALHFEGTPPEVDICGKPQRTRPTVHPESLGLRGSRC